jgi:ABC-type phosphate transport system auxiliary subunit
MPKVYISNGELIDKWTILLIKLEKLKDEKQVLNVSTEIELIRENVNLLEQTFFVSKEIMDLRQTNLIIWDLMDELYKIKSPNLEYGSLCFEVIKLNQRRSFIKREIDQKTKEDFNEEKSYFSKADWIIPDERD